MDKRYLVDTNFLVQAERYYPSEHISLVLGKAP
jgi:hypothetical protein